MNRQILCCGLEPIKNTALSKEFLYCRECKKEVFTEDRDSLDLSSHNVGPFRWNANKQHYELNQRDQVTEKEYSEAVDRAITKMWQNMDMLYNNQGESNE